MKHLGILRLLVILLVVSALIVTLGCSGDAQESDTTVDAQESDTTVEAQESDTNGDAQESDTFKLGILLPLTGTFAPVAETQRDGAIFAVEEVNARGGLDMPWGKVKVEYDVKDDEADITVGMRRLQYLKDEGVGAVLGQTWSPLAVAVNESMKRDPVPYFPTCATSRKIIENGALAPATWTAMYTPYSVGYMAGRAAINDLGKKKIYFLGRSDSWGWGIEEGVRAAAEANGGEVVGKDEVPVGTSDFTTIIRSVSESDADVFISAQFAGDAIALLKQSYDMGLYDEVTMFNAFITNVVAQGIPAEARDGLYSIHNFYWNMEGFEDPELVDKAAEFSQRFEDRFGNPPDAYAVIAYVSATRLFDAFETAGSFDVDDFNKAMAETSVYDSIKGPVTWREDHQPVYKYAGFLVKGKSAEGEWDLFDVVGYQGGEEVLLPLEALGY